MTDRDDERAEAEHACFIEIMDRLVRDQRIADLNAEKDQRIAALRAEVARLRGEAKMAASDIVERLSLQRYYPRCTTAEQRIAELKAENAELRDQQEELLAELAGLIALIDYESLTLPARKLMAKCMRADQD